MDPNLKVLFRIQDFAYRYSGTDPSTVVVHKMCQHNVLTAVKKSSCNIDYDFLELSGDNLLYKLLVGSGSSNIIRMWTDTRTSIKPRCLYFI